MSTTKATALLAGATLAFTAPAASALELGFQDQRAVITPDAPTAYAVARAVHARSMRLIVRWADVQPNRGAWHWAAYDDAVDQARAHGFRVQLVLGGIGQRPPGWAGRDNDDPDGLGSWRLMNDRAYLTFVAGAAAHFHGRVQTWSLLNEPDLTGYPAARYARLFVRGRAAIRRWAPRSRVLWGEFSPWHPISYTVQALQHHRVTADGFALHPYGTPGATPTSEGEFANLPVVRRLLRARATRHVLSTRRRAALPIYATEYGCAATSADCATMWAKALRGARALRLRQLVIYQLLSDDSGVRWNTSIAHADGTPRAAMSVLAR